MKIDFHNPFFHPSNLLSNRNETKHFNSNELHSAEFFLTKNTTLNYNLKGRFGKTKNIYINGGPSSKFTSH